MKTIYTAAALLISAGSFAQLKSVDTPYPNITYNIPVEKGSVKISETYDGDTKAALSALNKKEYATAAQLFDKAFKENNDLGTVQHRYKAACAFAAIGNNDRAFTELKRIAKSGHFSDVEEMENEKLLKPLHNDQRWKEVEDMIADVKQRFIDDLNNKEREKAKEKEEN